MNGCSFLKELIGLRKIYDLYTKDYLIRKSQLSSIKS